MRDDYAVKTVLWLTFAFHAYVAGVTGQWGLLLVVPGLVAAIWLMIKFNISLAQSEEDQEYNNRW